MRKEEEGLPCPRMWAFIKNKKGILSLSKDDINWGDQHMF